MTNNQHGQVPEALRLAEQYDHGGPAAHGNAWKAAVCTELRRLAELEAQIEALSGVQALSAAPAGFVPVAAFDRLHAHAESLAARLLAASPTPPAEQAAPKAATEEQALYTVDEVFDAIFETTKHLDIDPPPWDYIDDVKEHLSRINDPQYLEFLRLKAIYE